MPLYHRHYTPGHSQFITTSVYRRAQLFLSDRLADHFVDVLRELRAEMKFTLIGWVLMPEHFHVLLRAHPADTTTLIAGWRRPSLACDFRPCYQCPKQAGEGSVTTDLCIIANEFDTIYSLFNPTDRAQDFIATVYYGDGSGSYEMPVHFEAQASTLIDMMMLIGERRPEVHGNVIPPSVQQGSFVIESAKGNAQWMTLVVSGGEHHELWDSQLLASIDAANASVTVGGSCASFVRYLPPRDTLFRIAYRHVRASP